MNQLLSCEFNIDTACVELRYADGSMIAIDTIAVENEVADTMHQRSELDWLIYNCVRRLARSPRPAELSSRSAEIEQWHRPD